MDGFFFKNIYLYVISLHIRRMRSRGLCNTEIDEYRQLYVPLVLQCKRKEPQIQEVAKTVPKCSQLLLCCCSSTVVLSTAALAVFNVAPVCTRTLHGSCTRPSTDCMFVKRKKGSKSYTLRYNYPLTPPVTLQSAHAITLHDTDHWSFFLLINSSLALHPSLTTFVCFLIFDNLGS